MKNIYKINPFLLKIVFLSLVIIGQFSVFGQSHSSGISQLKDTISNHGTYVLIWHDEFNGIALDTAKSWNYEVNGKGGGNRELQYYTDSQKNCFLRNGYLVIQALNKTYKGKSFTSARINTKGKKEWKYGRFEIRAKLPTGKGTWPAFWLLGNDIDKVGWPACGEIDIMENVGFDPLWIHGSIHTPSSYGKTVNHGRIQVPDCATAYHIYGITWTPSKIEFYVDNPLKPYYIYSPTVKNDSNWPFNKPCFIILNLAIGGTWGGKQGVNNSIFPQTYSIDYVRVYQIKR